MGTIHTKVKKRRLQVGLTQEELADRLHIHVKTYQKIENGSTKMDLDRLTQISEVLEIPLIDLINTDDGININEVNQTNNGSINNYVEAINYHTSENEKEQYEKRIADKDKVIEDKDKEIAFLRSLLQDKLK